MSALGALSIGQPLGLVALVLPIAFLIAARERGKAQPRLVGSLAIWRRVSGAHEIASRRRKAPLTPRILIMAAAMALGALALTAPKWTHKTPPVIWRLVLDTAASNAVGGEQSRLQMAVSQGAAWTAEHAKGARIFWIGAPLESGLAEVEESGAGAAPSSGFLARLGRSNTPRRWSRFDGADCLWLPTSGSAGKPRLAGLPELAFASASGPVALLQSGEWLWWQAGGETSERPRAEGTPSANVRLAGAAFAKGSPLGDLVRAWGGERGLKVHAGRAEEGEVLSLSSAVIGADETKGTLGRDGWSAQVAWPKAQAGPASLEPWLSHRSTTLVAWRPGQIHLGFSQLAEPTGDPAAFAVSWATLFENAALAGPGIVSVADRGATEFDERSPAALVERSESGGGEQKDSELPLAPILAVLAATLLFVATRS